MSQTGSPQRSFVDRLLSVPRPRAGELAITEELGPKGKRNIGLLTLLSLLGVAAAGWWMYNRLGAATRLYPNGQFEGILWEPFKQPDTWRALRNGTYQTLGAAAVSIVVSLIIGLTMAALRHGSGERPIRLVLGMAGASAIALLVAVFIKRPLSVGIGDRFSAVGNALTPRPGVFAVVSVLIVALIAAPKFASTVYIEFFRACALVLLIASPFRFFDVAPWWSVVFGLTLYYSTTIAEVTRSSLRSLAKGQTEAGLAVGLTESQAMTSILMPQAIKRALPNLLTQTASLLKDTSLGFIVTFADLLNISQRLAKANDNYLPALVVCAAIYIVIIGAISFIANLVQRRQR
jgi:ABC-type amino acid transport system permease subunit